MILTSGSSRQARRRRRIPPAAGPFSISSVSFSQVLTFYFRYQGLLSSIHLLPSFRNGSISRISLPLRHGFFRRTTSTGLLSSIHLLPSFHNGSISRISLPLRHGQRYRLTDKMSCKYLIIRTLRTKWQNFATNLPGGRRHRALVRNLRYTLSNARKGGRNGGPGEGCRKDSRDRDGRGSQEVRKRTLRPMTRKAGVRKHF